MNTIIDNIDLWTSARAPKTAGRGNKAGNQSLTGIQKLRELILELAVRGKLVPQDPQDEPASELLKKISDGRSFLKIKKDELPFKLPLGWAWCRLGDIGITNIGLTYSPKEISDNGIPVLRSSNIQNGVICLNDLVRVNKVLSEKVLVQNDDLLICARNGSKNLVGKCALIKNLPEKAAFGAFMAIFRSNFNSYIKKFIESPIYRRSLEGVSTTTINQITQGNLKGTLLPLPPLAEQQRIITKVDELMSLCDKLEQQQSEHNELHETLVETLLANLTAATGQQESEEAWQRIAANFDTLFTTGYSIDQLKQSILQLAVMGRLVRQDKNDEPASGLLKKIAKEKAQLIKEGKIKNQFPLPAITDEEKSFELPEGWEWVRIGDVSLFTEYGMSEMTFDGIDGIPVLKMGDIQNGEVLLGGQKMVPKNVEGLPDLFLKTGDLLYNRTNSADLVGKTGFFGGENDKYTFASYLIRIHCSERNGFSRFLNLSMNEPSFRKTQIEPHLKQQCGQANVNGTILKNMLVPLPPLSEQHRIVAKVDELFAVCDVLKERIVEAKGIVNLMAEAAGKSLEREME